MLINWLEFVNGSWWFVSRDEERKKGYTVFMKPNQKFSAHFSNATLRISIKNSKTTNKCRLMWLFITQLHKLLIHAIKCIKMGLQQWFMKTSDHFSIMDLVSRPTVLIIAIVKKKNESENNTGSKLLFEWKIGGKQETISAHNKIFFFKRM